MTALLSGVVPSVAVIVAFLLTRMKIQQVHILVNSQMKAALEKIDYLEKRLSVPEEDKYR